MTQTTKKIPVTFTENELPGGTFAHFLHPVSKERYIAWPQSKFQAHVAVTDRLLGALTRVKRECLMWINMWPQDATRVARVMGIVRDSQRHYDENAVAKVEVVTS